MVITYRCYFRHKDGLLIKAENIQTETLGDAINECQTKLTAMFYDLGCDGFEIWQGHTCFYNSHTAQKRAS
jgi:hypothetical protein